MIDAHVHCRDCKQSSKETIEHALDVAKDSGLSAIFDMPNTDPTATTKKEIKKRLSLAKKANSPVFYGIHIGITSDKEQIKEAVETWKEYFPHVVGLKMFAGKSVGNLEIIKEEKQFEVYRELASLKYKGVLVVHCEKEAHINNKLWNPSKPSSHDDARPEKSEIESVKDQIRFASDANYEGRLHIAHVSVPESVDIICNSKNKLRISCGATPHHLLLDTSSIDNLRNGFLYKVNPPIRKPETRKKLLEYFLDCKIDILESDHAPHNYKEKFSSHLSGIPNLASWPQFIKLLKKEGMENDMLEMVAFENVNMIYNTRIKKLKLPVKNRTAEYVFSPYSNLK